MNHLLRLLIIEDSEDDTLLLLRTLRQTQYQVNYLRVEDGAAMKQALQETKWDLVISDYLLPRFDGLAALEILKQSQLDIPFIIVSGAIGEERAVEIMKAGAHDYVMKGNLTRLVPALERELREAEERRARKAAEEALRRSEAQLRALLDATTDVAFLMAADGTFLTLNKTFAAEMGKSTEEMVGHNGFDLIQGELKERRAHYFEIVRQTGKPIRWEDANEPGYWDNSVYPVLSASGAIEAFAVYSRDITERKRLENELQHYTTQLERMVEERTAELRHTKEQIELILNHTSDALALTLPDGNIQNANPAFITTFDTRVSQPIEDILKTVASDDQVTVINDALLMALCNGNGRSVETQIIDRNGRNKDLDLSMIPVRASEQNNRWEILVSAHDITHMKELERFKARFVADAVHDMATPIAGLSARLFLIKQNPAKLAEHLRGLENQVKHLRQLLDDLRLLSQFDQGQLTLDLSECDLNQMVANILDTYEPIALDKQQTMRLITDKFLPRIQLDSRQMERVLVNLFSNAVNYTPQGKEICIRTMLEGNHVVLWVEDEGMGIGAEHLPHVFERFYRAGEARKSQISGTGLGLAIVKQIVELHGGTIEVSSELGKGSIFKICLPYAKQL